LWGRRGGGLKGGGDNKRLPSRGVLSSIGVCSSSGECVRGVAGPKRFASDDGLRQCTWFPLGGGCKDGKRGARGVFIGVTVGVASAIGGEDMEGKGVGLDCICCPSPEREDEMLEERDEDEPASEDSGRSKDIPEGFAFSCLAFTRFRWSRGLFWLALSEDPDGWEGGGKVKMESSNP
jgi:hypothetical protein